VVMSVRFRFRGVDRAFGMVPMTWSVFILSEKKSLLGPTRGR
jgi:hypothetical protein